MLKISLGIILPIIIIGCAGSKGPHGFEEKGLTSETPKVQREFRAAWIATVANIHWPSEPGLPVQKQKEEAIELLDFLYEHHFNAIIFQVRPQCDALYPSALEPWSYFLTGEQGSRPEPYYDPLEFWIAETHERGMEFHAWLNPYRAHHKDGGVISNSSIVTKKPELVVHLKEGYYWMIPTEEETQIHSHNVVMDIVKRYDVDGIHFDDYFYPYPSYNDGKDFPDNGSWDQYKKSDGKLSKGDWRRDAVNSFIKELYQDIKKTKKHVKFGLSPFGIWKPAHPASIEGFDQYEGLYADAKLWLNEGWIDYYTPQLYWPINRIPQSFPVLLGWWKSQNYEDRHLWPGISLGRLNNTPPADGLTNNIMITRGMLPESPGIAHWGFQQLMGDTAISNTLLKGAYKNQALVPATPWLDKSTPEMPDLRLEISNDSVLVSWEQVSTARQYVIYSKYDQSWDAKVVPGSTNSVSIPFLKTIDQDTVNLVSVGLSAVNRMGNESKISTKFTE